MKTVFIHLSDIHFKNNLEEDVNVILNAFFRDLKEQIKKIGNQNFYFILSGDLVYAAEEERIYSNFAKIFIENLPESVTSSSALRPETW